MQIRNILFGVGTLMLGVLAVIYADFALQWQPVPAIPMRAALAIANGCLLGILGVGAIWKTTSRPSLLALGIYYTVWVLALHVPKVAMQPADLSRWNGIAEIGAMATAAFASHDERVFNIAHRAFGLCLVVFGACHFMYAEFTASMIPAWLPFPLALAYLTGIGHLAAGASLIFGVFMRPASILLTAMFASFVLLLHTPRVIAHPLDRIEWTMLAVSITLTGAAVIIASRVRDFASPK